MANFDGRSYQARIDALAAGGMDIHGEAARVMSRQPRTVLDAGCGTGRVAIELARRGVTVVGVDVDASMIAEARRRAPDLQWVEGDLADLDRLTGGRVFEVVVLAGNVPLFCPEGSRTAMVAACAGRVRPGGCMIAGFQLDRGYSLDDYDAASNATGLVLQERWSTWDAAPFSEQSVYAVSVHTRPESRDPSRGAPSGRPEAGEP